MTCEAKKRRLSLAVEGELPEDGLAAFGDDGDDMMMAPARKIVSGGNDAETVEQVFAQARDAEELLVDDAWKAVEVSVHDLTSVQDYSKRRTNGLSLPTVCETCKPVAGQWAKNRSLKLETYARKFRAGADKLDRMAAACLAKADGLRRRAEEAERDAARYRSSAERRNLEAARLEAEADE